MTLYIDDLKKLPPSYDGKVVLTRQDGSRRVFTVNREPSMTDQQWSEECDTNYILEKFRRTGQVTHLAKSQGIFADVSNVQDLLPSLIKMKEAEDAFLQYPAEVRRRFDNDVVKMLQFLDDPKNDDEAKKLGLRVSGPDDNLAANKSEARVSPPPQKTKTPKNEPIKNDDD